MSAEAAARADELKTTANKAVVKSDFKAAVENLSEAITLMPKQKELWSNRAFALSALGRHDDALSDARQCMAIAPAFAKGYLRAGRALISLGRHEEAAELLEDASSKMPQDYSLQEALSEAVAGMGSASAPAAGQPPASAAMSASGTSSASGTGAAGGGCAGGLDSSYYYAAVSASQRKLPVSAPQRIDTTDNVASGAVKAVANGAVREDIDRKGADSYYYAHDRKADFTVPTVPKRLNADGSMTPWDGS